MDENRRRLEDGMHQQTRHELRDVTVRPIVGFCIGLLLLVAFSFWVTRVLFKYFAAREAKVTSTLSLVEERPQLPPEPRLQTNPRADLRELREAEEKRLDSYGWVDRNAGIVHIPIDDAIKLTLQRGLPSRPATEQQVVK